MPSHLSGLKKVFQAPSGDSIRGRQAAMRSTFVRALIPAVTPSEEDIAEALDLLEQDAEALECSYCGDPSTEWDHLYPVMRNGKPTGHLTTIQNLVPACAKCNQSKGNQDWRVWILGNAPRSPHSRGVKQLKSRVRLLERYADWGAETRVDFEEVLDRDDYAEHWGRLEEILELMKEADVHARELRERVAEQLPQVEPRVSWFRRLWRWIFGG